MLIERLNGVVIEALESIAGQVGKDKGAPPFLVQRATKPGRGDFTCAAALRAKGQDDRRCLEIAEQIASFIRTSAQGKEMVARVEIVVPGYLNFVIHKQCFTDILMTVHAEKCQFGRQVLSEHELAALRQWAQNLGLEPLAYCLDGDKGTVVDTERIGPTSRQDPPSFVRYVLNRCLLFRKSLLEETANVHEGKVDSPLFTPEEWLCAQQKFASVPSVFDLGFALDKRGARQARTLTLCLDDFARALKMAISTGEPCRLAVYVYDLASRLEEYLQSFYLSSGEKAVITARIGIVAAAHQVLGNVLSLLGAQAREGQILTDSQRRPKVLD